MPLILFLSIFLVFSLIQPMIFAGHVWGLATGADRIALNADTFLLIAMTVFIPFTIAFLLARKIEQRSASIESTRFQIHAALLLEKLQTEKNELQAVLDNLQHQQYLDLPRTRYADKSTELHSYLSRIQNFIPRAPDRKARNKNREELHEKKV